MITRHQFLVGRVAGMILPRWLKEIEPLLQQSRHIEQILYAVDRGGNELQLYLGNPYEEEMPDIAWAFDLLKSMNIPMEEGSRTEQLRFYDGVSPGNASRMDRSQFGLFCPQNSSSIWFRVAF